MSEISGIIKNGIQRGWAPQEIYQSLINSGYNPQEIQAEITSVSASLPKVQPISGVQGAGQKLAPYQVLSTQEKKSSGKAMIITLVILALLTIIGVSGFLIFSR